jgi:3-hydroxyacyl-CoA dehydrogenase/enoyl-CoA hydratase/3-hydroxybutyryl-CoA epimerase
MNTNTDTVRVPRLVKFPPMPRPAGPRETLVGLTCIHGRISDEGVMVLVFDRPDSSANVFNRTTLEELNRHLTFIERHPELRGVLLLSAKPGIFIAGADLHEMAGELMGAHDSERAAGASSEAGALEVEYVPKHSPKPDAGGAADHEVLVADAEPEMPERRYAGEDATATLHELIDLGQRTFSRLADLTVPTVAAIHGACVGGGYEVCLACDYRLASNDRATRIGLPETQLGLLPAWGGSTRLPRLIGLPKAMEIILGGKVLAAKAALKAGLVDRLVPAEYLYDEAMRALVGQGEMLKQREHAFLTEATTYSLVAKTIGAWSRPKLHKKTRGHYPAVARALDVMVRGLGVSLEESQRLEGEAMMELAQTEATRNLLRLFFLQEHAKKFSPDVRRLEVPPVRRAAVIGAGVMGAGIAQWLSSKQVHVILRDVSPEQAGRGLETVARLYDQGVKRRVFDRVEARAGLDRVSAVGMEVPLHGVEVVIEAAVEAMELKQALFQRLAEQTGRGTVLATNTSALSISAIAEATSAPERVVGMHFFNPVHRMQLVEVIAGQQTDNDILRRAVRFVQQIGKLPVLVQDRPGFLVNRILMPYLLEAGHLWEAGASVEDLDEAMLDFGMPMGPMRLIDEVGVDVAAHVARTLTEAFPRRMVLPGVLTLMLKAGLTGRKGGRGFFLHAGRMAVPNPDLEPFRERGIKLGLTRLELQERMVLLMVNEAARCLEEDGVATPEDVDFGMILGTGFAPFRGGPLRYADFTGIQVLVEAMNSWVAAGAKHFAPCALLEGMAANDGTFYAKGL